MENIDIFTREKAIEKLVGDDIANICQEVFQDEFTWLDEMLKKGFRGYEECENSVLEGELISKFDLPCIVLGKGKEYPVEEYQAILYLIESSEEASTENIDKTWKILDQKRKELYKE